MAFISGACGLQLQGQLRFSANGVIWRKSGGGRTVEIQQKGWCQPADRLPLVVGKELNIHEVFGHRMDICGVSTVDRMAVLCPTNCLARL